MACRKRDASHTIFRILNARHIFPGIRAEFAD